MLYRDDPFSLGTWTEEETLEVDSKSNYNVIKERAKAAGNHGTYKLIKLIDRTGTSRFASLLVSSRKKFQF